MLQFVKIAFVTSVIWLVPASALQAAVSCEHWNSQMFFFQVASAVDVKNCIANGADVHVRDEDGWTPLHSAVVYNDASTVMALVESGAGLEAQTNEGLTPLHMAAGFNVEPTMVSILLDAGANMNARDLEEQTPLHLAADSGMVKALLGAGADLAARDDIGRTPLHTAAFAARLSVVKALLNAGPDLEARDDSEYTPLHLAAGFNVPSVVTALLDAGTDVNARDKDGRVPLHIAARHSDKPSVIMALLDSSANANARSADFETPWSQIQDNLQLRNTEAYRRLEEAYAEALELCEDAAPAQAQGGQELQGRRFRDCEECPELVLVPSGRFMMGSPTGEEGRTEWEGPVRSVTIAKPFAVGVYEVTLAEFGRFVRETGHSPGETCVTQETDGTEERSGRSWRHPGFNQTDVHPVTCVDWNDAKEYVLWLSQGTGKYYRLLSESEWEYVARGGTTTSRHWGDESSAACGFTNVTDRSTWDEFPELILAGYEYLDGYAQTAPVGSFSANKFGLYDVLGNVWEWVEDCWHESYAGAPGDGRAWTDGGDCGRRVVRGGSWVNSTWDVRSAFRQRVATQSRNATVGFRVARTLD